jgi:hypothetical protein
MLCAVDDDEEIVREFSSRLRPLASREEYTWLYLEQ